MLTAERIMSQSIPEQRLDTLPEGQLRLIQECMEVRLLAPEVKSWLMDLKSLTHLRRKFKKWCNFHETSYTLPKGWEKNTHEFFFVSSVVSEIWVVALMDAINAKTRKKNIQQQTFAGAHFAIGGKWHDFDCLLLRGLISYITNLFYQSYFNIWGTYSKKV